MLKNTGQKRLWILLECSFEIFSKIVIFRSGENTLLKYKHFVNSWERRFKMKLLRVCTPLQYLCFIVSICKKCLQPVCYFPSYNAISLFHYMFTGTFLRKCNNPNVQLESKFLLHYKLSIINIHYRMVC